MSLESLDEASVHRLIYIITIVFSYDIPDIININMVQFVLGMLRFLGKRMYEYELSDIFLWFDNVLQEPDDTEFWELDGIFGHSFHNNHL